MKRIIFSIIILIITGCNEFSGKADNANKKVDDYLGIHLDGSSNVKVFEYDRMSGYIYPRSVYISFDCLNPESIITNLNLLPSKYHLNKDTFRIKDYEYAKSINNFWKTSSTIETKDVVELENEKLDWWKPTSDTSILTYAGFYSEGSKTKIVKAKEEWTGRLNLQFKKNKIFIQIDLLESPSKTIN